MKDPAGMSTSLESQRRLLLEEIAPGDKLVQSLLVQIDELFQQAITEYGQDFRDVCQRRAIEWGLHWETVFRALGIPIADPPTPKLTQSSMPTTPNA